MNESLTTELLCRLLKERGLSCQTHYQHASWCVGSKLYEAADNFDGTLTVSGLTPEQAMTATLGNEREQLLEGVLRDLIACDPKCTNRSCGDCEHEEDDGCGLYRRIHELGVISR